MFQLGRESHVQCVKCSLLCAEVTLNVTTINCFTDYEFSNFSFFVIIVLDRL